MTSRPPKSLTPHPLLAKLPTPDRNDPTWGSFSDNVQFAGPDAIPPISICGQHVVDGRRRLMAAQDWDWPEIRCIEVPEDQAAVVIVESMIGQRSISRGAKLYLSMKLLKEYLQSLEARRKANLKQNRKNIDSDYPISAPKHSDCVSVSVKESLLARIGVGTTTWDMAVKVHKLFSDKPELKAEYEPKLFSGEGQIWGLWQVLSAVGGAEKTKDLPRPVNSGNQLELFDSALAPMVRAVKPWGRIMRDEKEKIILHWRQAAMKMPPEACEELGNIFLEAAKVRLQTA